MKNIIYLSAFFILSINAFSQITFQKAYEGPGGFSKQTFDGGYIIATSGSTKGMSLIKTDMNGAVLWRKNYQNTRIFISCIQQTSDNGFILCGTSGYIPTQKIYLMKTDANGSVLWSNGYQASELDNGYFVEQTKDGGYIITGARRVLGINSIYLFKTDAGGNLTWVKSYGDGINDFDSYGVTQTNDSGYVLVGQARINGIHMYVIKANSNGDILWTSIIGDNIYITSGKSIKQILDGNYIISGSTNNKPSLVKINDSGKVIWCKRFSGGQEGSGNDVKQTSDGGFIFTGIIGNFSQSTGPHFDVCLIKTDFKGDTLWTKMYGSVEYFNDFDDDEGYTVEQTNDGGYVVAGSSLNFNIGGTCVYLIKTDVNGNSGCNNIYYSTIVSDVLMSTITPSVSVSPANLSVASISLSISNTGTVNDICSSTGVSDVLFNQGKMNVYPNPVGAIFNISIGKNIKEGNLEIFNALGEKIYSDVFNGYDKIVTCKLNQGIFLIQLTNGNDTWSSKIIKE